MNVFQTASKYSDSFHNKKVLLSSVKELSTVSIILWLNASSLIKFNRIVKITSGSREWTDKSCQDRNVTFSNHQTGLCSDLEYITDSLPPRQSLQLSSFLICLIVSSFPHNNHLLYPPWNVSEICLAMMLCRELKPFQDFPSESVSGKCTRDLLD